jgi:hypothetical protein
MCVGVWVCGCVRVCVCGCVYKIENFRTLSAAFEQFFFFYHLGSEGRVIFTISKCGAKFKILKCSKQTLSPFPQHSTLYREDHKVVAFFANKKLF